MTNQTTVHSRTLPAPSAWEDPAARKAANRTLVPAITLAAIGLLALAVVVVAFAVGWLARYDWVLWTLVAAGAVAGGCLGGGGALLWSWRQLRKVLHSAPWHTIEVEPGEGRKATLSKGANSIDVQLDGPARQLGDHGSRCEADVCLDPDSARLVIALWGRTRLFGGREVAEESDESGED